MMNLSDSVVWILPLILAAVAFLTSGIRGFRFVRLGVYVAVFLAAFLLDLQATSFKYDVLDSIFSLLVLLVFGDMIWKIIRLKTKILRVVGLLAGIVLFIAFYGSWIIGGPKGVAQKHSTEISSGFKIGKQAYYIKKRLSSADSSTRQEYILYKVRCFSLMEQYCKKYSLPEGYAKANVTFDWKKRGNIADVRIIGDNDTLWTLDSDITPK